LLKLLDFTITAPQIPQEHPLADVFGAEGNPDGMASLGTRKRFWMAGLKRLGPSVFGVGT